MNEALINEQMLEAGVATLLEQLPVDVLNEHSLEPAEMVVALFQAMSRKEWLPIATGPRTGVNILLAAAAAKPADVKMGIGMWVDAGDDSGSGHGRRSNPRAANRSTECRLP
jgi:hypothetical protein